MCVPGFSRVASLDVRFVGEVRLVMYVPVPGNPGKIDIIKKQFSNAEIAFAFKDSHPQEKTSWGRFESLDGNMVLRFEPKKA